MDQHLRQQVGDDARRRGADTRQPRHPVVLARGGQGVDEPGDLLFDPGGEDPGIPFPFVLEGQGVDLRHPPQRRGAGLVVEVAQPAGGRALAPGPEGVQHAHGRHVGRGLADAPLAHGPAGGIAHRSQQLRQARGRLLEGGQSESSGRGGDRAQGLSLPRRAYAGPPPRPVQNDPERKC